MISTPFMVSACDKRKYERISLQLSGKLFNPINKATVDCDILNLSAGGAAFRCASEFPKGCSLVLYIENFGRFEGKTIVHENGQHVLEFTIREEKRGRLVEMLKSFMREGVAGVMRMRTRVRAPVDNIIILENGKREAYDITDISLEGLTLRTRLRPSIGEIVNLGRIHARVIRHDVGGIAVEYVRESTGTE